MNTFVADPSINYSLLTVRLSRKWVGFGASASHLPVPPEPHPPSGSPQGYLPSLASEQRAGLEPLTPPQPQGLLQPQDFLVSSSFSSLALSYSSSGLHCPTPLPGSAHLVFSWVLSLFCWEAGRLMQTFVLSCCCSTCRCALLSGLPQLMPSPAKALALACTQPCAHQAGHSLE